MKTICRFNYLQFWSVILLIASLACAPGTAVKLEDAAPVVQDTYKVGDLITLGDSVIMVLGWENVPGSEYVKPDAGKKFVSVELLILNRSAEKSPVSTMLQMSMKDDTGQKYTIDFMATSTLGIATVDGELLPGEKIRGMIGFQIAEEAKGLQFVYDASLFKKGKAIIELGAEPVSVDPPTNLEGEIPLKTQKMGETVVIGTTNILINKVDSPAGSEYNKPNEGRKFLVVDLTIENKGKEAIDVSTMTQMSIRDTEGRKYGVDFMATSAAGGTAPDGEVAVNEKLRGQVGFQVPETAANLILEVDGDKWNTGKVFILLP